MIIICAPYVVAPVIFNIVNYTVTDTLEPGQSQNCKIQVSQQGATIQVRI